MEANIEKKNIKYKRLRILKTLCFIYILRSKFVLLIDNK